MVFRKVGSAVTGARRVCFSLLAFLAISVAFALGNPMQATASTSFADVPSNHWVVREGWLAYVLDHGLMSGYRTASGSPTGSYGPEDSLTRGQVAAVLFRIANPNNDATTNPAHYAATTGFKDNGALPYYRAAVKWLKNKRIATGDQDLQGHELGTFRPDDPISRQELGTLAFRFAKVTGIKMSTADPSTLAQFYDGDQVLPFAREALAWCGSAGLITGGSGKDRGKLFPSANATRAQASKILAVLHQDYVKKSSDVTFSVIKGSYTFSSGAGGWQTVLDLKADGSFTGYYSDYDLGDTGSLNPKGTVYHCEFSGSFSHLTRVDGNSYSMTLDKLVYSTPTSGYEYKDGYLYEYTDAYGLAESKEFKLYLPGTLISRLPTDYQSWNIAFDNGYNGRIRLYGIYNVKDHFVFARY